MVRAIENPMGELELSNRERVKAERDAHVWEEIRRAYQRGGIVRGRVLNAVGGGYAVGIAGAYSSHWSPYDRVGVVNAVS